MKEEVDEKDEGGRRTETMIYPFCSFPSRREIVPTWRSYKLNRLRLRSPEH